MKKISVFVLIGMLSAQLAFGACEEETRKRDRAKELADDWGKKSEQGAAIGSIIGGIVAGCVTANPWIGLAIAGGGGIVGGGVPGLACARLKALYDYHEEVLRVCLEDDKNQKLVDAENRKMTVIKECASNAGVALGGIFKNRLQYYIQIANTEINQKINDYISNNLDLTDPGVQAQLQSEIDAINRKYF